MRARVLTKQVLEIIHKLRGVTEMLFNKNLVNCHKPQSFRKMIVLFLVIFFTMGAGISAVSINYSKYEIKSIDLIFSSGFEKTLVATLSSEVPFNGTLPAPEADHETVGFSPGNFNVDSTGQASYSIPIFAGSGTAGVAPQVSLQYSSTSGNGHVGIGWFVSGITLISRCRETAESRDSGTEITPKPITYGNGDKFCLNGQRLFISNNGAYGANGTEYRTEKDQFARIISYGGSNNNPDYFTVERKDGSISFYGNTVNSTITIMSQNMAINGKTYTWAINRYQDIMGNYIDYKYNKFANAEFTLTDINYTGNVLTGLSPYNSIHFTYESRDDEYTSYLSGAAFDTTQRLAQITSRIDGSLVREYTLDYDYSGSTSRSLLTSIQECRGLSCLPVTTFDWSAMVEPFVDSDTGSGVSFPTNVKSSKQGDINADGRADLVFVDDTNTFKVALANGQAGFILDIAPGSSITAPTGAEIDNKWHLLDYNADGRQDLLIQSGSQWVVHMANLGTIGFNSTPTFIGVSADTGSDFQIVDVNGDGLADLLYPTDDELSVRYLQRQDTSYGFATTAVPIDLPGTPADVPGIPVPGGSSHMSYRFYQDDDINIVTNDINGDGVADLILRSDVYQGSKRNNTSYKFLSVGKSPLKSSGQLISSHWVAFIGKGLDNNNKLDYYSESYYIKEASSLADSAGKDIKFIDINADGLTDVIAKNTTNNWQFRLGNGKGFDSFKNIPPISNEKHMQLIDYNLDGFVDLVYPNSGRYFSRNWSVDGFSNVVVDTGSKPQNLNQNLNMFIDLSGDGNTDHIRIDSGGQQRVYPRTTTYIPTDKITAFTNGLGATTDVLYQPLTFSNTYTQGDHQTTAINYGLGSPVFDLMGAIYVVRQVDTDAPIEGDESFKNTVRYRYKNAKVQTGGRGFLGFGQVITETPVKSTSSPDVKILESTSTYRQDFPYNGMLASTEIRQLNDSFYAANKVKLNCNGYDDSCFPPPCEPGVDCNTNSQKGTHNILLSKIDNEYNELSPSTNSKFAYVETTSHKIYSPETGALLKTEIQTSTHDNYGNPLVHTVTTKNASDTIINVNTVVNSYSNITNGGKWLIGLLESSTITKTRTGQPANTTVTEFDYNTSTGLVTEERKDPEAGSELFLRTMYQYDNYGNNIKITTCSGNTLTSSQCKDSTPEPATTSNPYHIHRYNRVVYDSKGRYVAKTFNTLEQKVSDVTTRDIYGNPITSVDILDQITTNNYDVFGRLTSTRNNTGYWSQTSRSWCSSLSGSLACPAGMNLQFRVRQLDAGGKTSYIYMDSLGREVVTISKTFNQANDPNTSGDDRYVLNKIWYDQFNRKIKSEGDHFLGASQSSIPITRTELDNYNRVSKVTLPDNSSETKSYSGFATHYSNDKGQRRKDKRNPLGQLVIVRDFDVVGTSPSYKNRMTYTYNSQGGLALITRKTNSVIERLIENEYDIRGRKISSDDVDLGFSQIFYNALGEIVETIDSEDNSIKTYFDVLGRPSTTESWDGNSMLTRNYSIYNIDNGLLGSESKQTFTPNNTIVFSQNHRYDAYNRASETEVYFTDIDNVCGASLCNYKAKVFYDQYSRLKYQQDVSGKAIQNHYNSQGYLSHVTDAADASKEYYRINKTDKWGNVTNDVKAGNPALTAEYTFHPERGWLNSINSAHQDYAYEYDRLGNLDKRLDVGSSQSECFIYDRLNRLTSSYRYSTLVQNCGETNGNIGQQIIDYDAKGNIITKDGQSYSYLTANENSIGVSPHQVQTKGSQNFIYDQRGNLTKSTNFLNGQGQLVNRNISYTGFNKISRIYTGANSSTPIAVSQYHYDNSENRYSRADTNKQGETTVTHFIGNVEIEYNANRQMAFKRHLGNYAVITETNQSTQETYLFHDHLGSIDTITDRLGNLLQQMSFSAWGERRLPANWDIITTTNVRSYLSDYTTKGFTGHEMLDVFGLINMGGRIYDAELGKMLQADPVVQDPNTSQSYNRYTYVHNNPLSFTDPTGYFSLRQIIAIVVAVVLVVVVTAMTGGTLLGVFLAGFLSGFSSTYIMTGNLRTSLKAGLISGVVAVAGSYLTGLSSAADASATAGSSNAAGGVGNTVNQTALSGTIPVATSSASSTVANKIVSEITMQVIASLDPRAAAVISFINGGVYNSAGQFYGYGATVQNLASAYGKYRAAKELERFAIRNGLSYAELTLAMTAISFAGNKLVGSRFNANEQINGQDQQMMHGVFGRQEGGWLVDSASSPIINSIVGSPFDAVDIVLGYAGILTASDYDFIQNGNPRQKLIGHSLGTLGVSNIVAKGYLDAGMAEMYSLPFGNISPGGSTLVIGTFDVVNGFFFGVILNPNATLVTDCTHPLNCYVNTGN
ncbi:hypothetical protein MNBD_GAMMA01-1146 [hydrothermal vent metagenome]|uniref:Insecticide toxin TcdB middle/N-terminal domain-containing protein n=1 Tax=hydrothermal vent metagenome TaxID=652676 RepID=A0A3B0V5H3_9ZZZZ